MSHNATPTDQPLRPDQLVALGRLIGGASVTEAAKSAGCSRETIHRWLKNDFVFLATLNRMKHELQDSIDAQLLAISGRATETVAKAVAGGDLKASLQVLRGTGMLSGDRARAGSEDPNHLKDDLEFAEEKDRTNRLLRRGRLT